MTEPCYKKANELVTYRTGKLDSNAAVEDGKYPFFTCAQETYQINNYAFDTECVLLAGNNAGGIFPLKFYKGKFNAYQRTYVIESRDPQRLNIKYFYFFLKPLLKSFEQQATGATTKFLTIKILKGIQVMLPDVGSQRKIAAILSAYDELIEINRRRISLLEKMAEEIYREWFVRLRFPGHEKVKIVKGVPEGWRRKKVATLTSYLKRGVAPQYDDSAEGMAINQKCIRAGKLDMSFARHQSRDVPADRQIRFGDVLINSTGEGTLGRVAQVLTAISNCIVDSHVTIVRPKPGVPIHYFGMTLKAWEVHFTTMGRGATNQTELAPSVIGNVEVTMPSMPLQEAFESHAEPLFAQITQLIAKNERFARTRDMLLPRLISGKLPVEKLDIRFPPSMEEEDHAT